MPDTQSIYLSWHSMRQGALLWQTIVTGLLHGIVCVILDLTILTKLRLVTDGRIDGQTDGHMITAYTVLE